MPALSREERLARLEALKATAERALGNLGLEWRIHNGELTVWVAPASLRAALAALRDSADTAMDVLTYITAIDYEPTPPLPGASQILPPGAQMLEPRPLVELGAPTERFELVYDLQSTVNKQRIRVKARLADTGSEENLPEVASVSDLYLTANWHERETYDLFGIVFSGHPDLRRILLPDRWDGYPLRKEYPFDGKKVWKVGATLVDGVMADENLGPIGASYE